MKNSIKVIAGLPLTQGNSGILNEVLRFKKSRNFFFWILNEIL